MSRSHKQVRVCAVTSWLAVAALTSGAALAQSAVQMLPNLKPLPASSFSLVNNSATGAQTLRFATTSWNNGSGTLQLEAGSVDTGAGKQQVYQRIFNSDGSSSLKFAGWFTWHNGHNHFHFDSYAAYMLQPVNAPGGSSRTGSKTTFCVMDTTAINLSLPGAPSQARFSSCGNQIQGMSVGWGDTYGAHLVGQELDFTDNADGIYQLVITVDPKGVIVEGDENDNVSCALINVKKPSTVTVLDSSGSCSTVTSISPNSATAGTAVQVTITGYGFSANTPVTFEGGNGARPVASNVQLASDTDGLDTITATVTVPYKKNIGRDPKWDVRVGTGGLLRDAFTVTR
jgi:hypothetical protein